VEELLTKLENKVKQALEKIEELESQNARLKEENDSLVETNLRLQGELEEKEGEVGAVAELRARLEASEAKQELARRRIETIITELDEILSQGAEVSEETTGVETEPYVEEEKPVPPGISLPVEVDESSADGEGEPEETTSEEETFPLLDLDDGEERPSDEPEPLPEENEGFTEEGEEPDYTPHVEDEPAAGEADLERDEDKDPFGGSF
jgi:seryl-tRNA synthetase